MRFAMIGATMFVALVVVGMVHTAKAADTVNQQRLEEVVNESARDCRLSADSKITIPMITWGADIVTIHAYRNGLFDAEGLDVELNLEDDFAGQVAKYQRCDTPLLRGTVGMAAQAVGVTEAEAQTAMILTHQMSWSVGGDAIVAKQPINDPADLCNARVAVQRFGPHVDYILTVAKNANCGSNQPKLVWVKDLTGPGDSTPLAALRDGDADAAMMIIPDALVATSDGTVGNGAEGSVNGAKIIMSTKTASRIIADAYFVRDDFAQSNPEWVEGFVRAWLKAEREVRNIVQNEGRPYEELFGEAAGILLNLPGEVEEARLLYNDAETVGVDANSLFVDRVQPRSFPRISMEVQELLRNAGLIRRPQAILTPTYNFGDIMNVTVSTQIPERFDRERVADAIAKRAQGGRLDDDTLFSFEISFKPNTKGFPAAAYEAEFEQIIALSSTYAGAVVVFEGHVDPNEYLHQKRKGVNQTTLKRFIQGAKSLSGQRATEAMQAIIDYANSRNIIFDPSQFDILAAGISDPIQGVDANGEPLPTPDEATWKRNMRVEARVINVEVEADVFRPLN